MDRYFRHASGEIFAISQALAQFISINRLFLHMYSHDDVSAGSWFIGLDVKHVDEGKFCCSSWSSDVQAKLHTYACINTEAENRTHGRNWKKRFKFATVAKKLSNQLGLGYRAIWQLSLDE
ncbi:Hexosyltransferase [Forsythia ovata]|uniref:Hexosyltransferase n=1 Tax=Forsythia ovata TaxID=205694 RepID=A0ABD1X849_9LAMI